MLDLYMFDHFPFSEVRLLAAENFSVTCFHLKVNLPSHFCEAPFALSAKLQYPLSIRLLPQIDCLCILPVSVLLG